MIATSKEYGPIGLEQPLRGSRSENIKTGSSRAGAEDPVAGTDEEVLPRICRIASFPTVGSPGTGLPGYKLCESMKTPTLFLTREVAGTLPVKDHIDLRMIPYPSPAFGERLSLGVALRKIFGLVKFFFRSIPAMNSFRPEIIHIHSPLYLMHAAWGRFVLRARICMTFHGSDLLRIGRSASLQYVMKKLVDRFFYVSETMAEDLERILPPGSYTYSPNGVDTSIFRDLGMQRKKQIVAVGNLRWQKGYSHLLEAFQSIEDEGFTMVIAGEGPLRKEMEAEIGRMGLNGRIALPGRLPQDKLVRLLNESSIYVMSSVSEGFPKALLEGIACGLPVVTTDAGCCRQVAADVGICVHRGDTDALAAALQKLAGDDGLRRRLASKTAETAAEYGWDVSCGIVRSAYLSLNSRKD